MREQNENKVKTGDDLVCPNCGGHQVRWVPYPKKEFGAMFILWLILSLITVKGTILVFAFGAVYWGVALVIRFKQNQRAALVNMLHCDTCGTDFEVSKDVFQKGGKAG